MYVIRIISIDRIINVCNSHYIDRQDNKNNIKIIGNKYLVGG